MSRQRRNAHPSGATSRGATAAGDVTSHTIRQLPDPIPFGYTDWSYDNDGMPTAAVDAIPLNETVVAAIVTVAVPTASVGTMLVGLAVAAPAVGEGTPTRMVLPTPVGLIVTAPAFTDGPPNVALLVRLDGLTVALLAVTEMVPTALVGTIEDGDTDTVPA